MYYFDVHGNFCELEEERDAEPTPPRKPPICKRRTPPGPQRVVGPRATTSGWLSEGESEYLTE